MALKCQPAALFLMRDRLLVYYLKITEGASLFCNKQIMAFISSFFNFSFE
jgi:hypothetical protein